jgi:hypothetical protein
MGKVNGVRILGTGGTVKRFALPPQGKREVARRTSWMPLRGPTRSGTASRGR